MRVRAGLFCALAALGWSGEAQAQWSAGYPLSATYCVLGKQVNGVETAYLSKAFLTRWGEAQNDSFWYAVDRRPDSRMLQAMAAMLAERHGVTELDNGGCITNRNRLLAFEMRRLFAAGSKDKIVEIVWPADAVIDSQSIETIAAPPAQSADEISRDLLDYVIQTWFWEGGGDWRDVMSPALRAASDLRQAEQSAEIKRHGHVMRLRLLGSDAKGRVFRVTHERAVLDWTIVDDGRTITALSWAPAAQ
ncbi:MAG: hypothetical protein V4574_20870 [Pseudomonadota bacterium]